MKFLKARKRYICHIFIAIKKKHFFSELNPYRFIIAAQANPRHRPAFRLWPVGHERVAVESALRVGGATLDATWRRKSASWGCCIVGGQRGAIARWYRSILKTKIQIFSTFYRMFTYIDIWVNCVPTSKYFALNEIGMNFIQRYIRS